MIYFKATYLILNYIVNYNQSIIYSHYFISIIYSCIYDMGVPRCEHEVQIL